MEQEIARRHLHLSGRQDEFSALWNLFEQCTTGRLRVAMLAGEPGIGKTCLLTEVARHAEQAGALVLRGGAFQAEGMPPFQSFLEALGGYIRVASPADLRIQAGPMASVLATILPELALVMGDVPPNYPLPSEQARLRLFEAVGMFLSNLSRSAPLVLILDDLQWADSASLDLLRHVVRQQPAARLLILGAYRAGELMSNPTLEHTLVDLHRTRLLTSLPLGPLAEEELATLAATSLGFPVDLEGARLLARHSEGNPFFAEELLRSWIETRALDIQSGLFTQVGELPDTIPSSIIGIVQERLSRLPAATVEILRSAALVGRTFEVAFLASVLGQEDAETLDEALRVAVRAGLVREDLQDTLTFSHDKVRECLIAALPPLRRRRLHGFIGRILEAQPDKQSAQRLADLAFHFTRSGDRARGARYARRAAEQALETSAPEEALKHYRIALDLLAAQDSERGSLLLHCGEAAIQASKEREAVTVFEEAQGYFKERGDMLSAAQAAHGLGRAWSRLESYDAALSALETARVQLEEYAGTELVQVLVDLATLLAVSLGRQHEGVTYGQQALALALELHDYRLQATANRTVGNLLMRANQFEEALPLLERALSQARMMDDPCEASECCACLTLAYVWSGHYQQAHAACRERLEWAQRTGEQYQVRHIYSMLTLFSMEQGQLAEAEQLLPLAHGVLISLASPEPPAFLLHCQGWLAYYQGDYAGAETYFAQAVELFRELGPHALIWYLGPLGLAQARQGKRLAALSCVDELEILLKETADHSMARADALSKLTQIALIFGDSERCEKYYPQLLPFQSRFIDTLVDRLLGEVETLLSAWSQAQTYLDAAEATARREDILPELAWTLVAQGKLALAQGGRGSVARARLSFEQAHALFQQVGMNGEIEVLQTQLKRLPKKLPTRPSHALPAGLSQREAEVLRLVVAGKSNRQIAETLVLSEKTVANHIMHIFNKTGTENRTAAAAFALRHGLA